MDNMKDKHHLELCSILTTAWPQWKPQVSAESKWHYWIPHLHVHVTANSTTAHKSHTFST
jgi:hypothetical protein